MTIIFQAQPVVENFAQKPKRMVSFFIALFLILVMILLVGSFAIYQRFELPGERNAHLAIASSGK